MAGMSDYLEGQIRAHVFRTASYTKPTVLAISLHTADPTDVTATANANEVANAGSYARVARNPLDANWTAASATDGITTNAATITFPAPTANWGVVTHLGIYDSSAYGGGNLLFSGALTTPKTINNGDAAPSFAIGSLAITFS
jgi:hypothetical protein